MIPYRPRAERRRRDIAWDYDNTLSPLGRRIVEALLECAHGREICAACVDTGRCPHRCEQCREETP
jgi:hypothetical protein